MKRRVKKLEKIKKAVREHSSVEFGIGSRRSHPPMGALRMSWQTQKQVSKVQNFMHACS